MPGGGPQGTILGMFLFLILINEAGFKEENKELGIKITSAVNKRKEIDKNHWKYVDDLTIAECIHLKEVLKKDTANSPARPLTYHNRTKHIFPSDESEIQMQLNELSRYADVNEMKINKEKTKVMLFNTAKTRDFTPQMKIENEEIEVVEKLKLLGVMITDDLKWNCNTSYITSRGYRKLWILRRLKIFGASNQQLKDIYFKQVRSILEYAAVVWHSSLTQTNTAHIERVQKCALAIILGEKYTSYENALKLLKIDQLSIRREALCKKFARKTFKNEKYDHWFVRDQNTANTRRQTQSVKPVLTRTKRFMKSALPYITSLVNIDN